MTTAAICSTKNEADIIELFVRLNARICDVFFFADDSTDHTRAILEHLSDEGYDVRYLPRVVHEGEHNQPRASRAYLSYVADVLGPEWVFFLDADEIIVADDRAAFEAEARAVGPDAYLVAPWRTYVPASLDYFDSESPLSHCFAPRNESGVPYGKVSIPAALARVVATTAGNHDVCSLVGAVLKGVPASSYFLAHFPVRSAEQILVKNLIATHNLASRADAQAGEGHHVRPVLDAIRGRHYQLSLRDVVAIANGYALESATTGQGATAERPGPDPRFQVEWRYRELARIDVVARLDAELERYAAELRRARERLRASTWHSVRLQLVEANGGN